MYLPFRMPLDSRKRRKSFFRAEFLQKNTTESDFISWNTIIRLLLDLDCILWLAASSPSSIDMHEGIRPTPTPHPKAHRSNASTKGKPPSPPPSRTTPPPKPLTPLQEPLLKHPPTEGPLDKLPTPRVSHPRLARRFLAPLLRPMRSRAEEKKGRETLKATSNGHRLWLTILSFLEGRTIPSSRIWKVLSWNWEATISTLIVGFLSKGLNMMSFLEDFYWSSMRSKDWWREESITPQKTISLEKGQSTIASSSIKKKTRSLNSKRKFKTLRRD